MAAVYEKILGAAIGFLALPVLLTLFIGAVVLAKSICDYMYFTYGADAGLITGTFFFFLPIFILFGVIGWQSK